MKDIKAHVHGQVHDHIQDHALKVHLPKVDTVPKSQKQYIKENLEVDLDRLLRNSMH